MPMSKTIALAFFAAFACAAPALAEDNTMTLKDGQMMMVKPDGTVTTMDTSKMNADAPDMMMKNGQEMSDGMMIMMENGKVFTMEDKKMEDGKMTSDMMMNSQ